MNAFEHIPNPELALREALRVTKPGGILYLSFTPIWTADTGNHFPHLVPEPWKHLLVSTEDFVEAIRSKGGTQSDADDFVRGLNRRLPHTFYEDFPAILDQCKVSNFKMFSWGHSETSPLARHPNRIKAAALLGIPAADLLIHGFSFVITR